MKPKLFFHRPLSPNSKVAFAFLALSLAVSGCVKEEDLIEASSSGSSGSVTSPDASHEGGVYLYLSRAWEQLPDVFFDLGSCTVPAGSAPGTNQTCTITVPEAELFYSQLKMVAGTSDSTTCSLVILRPFYYQGSSTAGFLPGWDPTVTSAIDCSQAPIQATCFNGPATQVDGFPEIRGIYSATVFNPEISKTVDAGNESGQLNNRWLSNSLVDQATPIANWYKGTAGAGEVTWQDYVAECRDAHYELIYRVTITLADEDTSTGEDPGGPTDHFSDWDGM